MERVKVLLLGDSGVGKSSLAAALATPISGTGTGDEAGRTTTTTTIGAHLEVRIHLFAAGTPRARPVAVELWDVGGSRGHALARPILYAHPPPNGLILVHDLTNRKSAAALSRWRTELYSHLAQNEDVEGIIVGGSLSSGSAVNSSSSCARIPTLVVGTKEDLLTGAAATRRTADDLDLDLMREVDDSSWVSLRAGGGPSRSFQAGSTNAVKLSRFLDRVVEERHRSAGLPLVSHTRTFVPTHMRPSTSTSTAISFN